MARAIVLTLVVSRNLGQVLALVLRGFFFASPVLRDVVLNFHIQSLFVFEYESSNGTRSPENWLREGVFTLHFQFLRLLDLLLLLTIVNDEELVLLEAREEAGMLNHGKLWGHVSSLES